jgi:hypothetical protein
MSHSDSTEIRAVPAFLPIGISRLLHNFAFQLVLPRFSSAYLLVKEFERSSPESLDRPGAAF